MKYLKTFDEKCVGCGACMETCSTAFFKENNPEKSAVRVRETAEKKYKISVCNQKCRLCVDECPVIALTLSSQGVVLLNKKLCVGCMACVAVCPINAMMRYNSGINPFKCIACGACAKKCPENALLIVNEEV